MRCFLHIGYWLFVTLWLLGSLMVCTIPSYALTETITARMAFADAAQVQMVAPDASNTGHSNSGVHPTVGGLRITPSVQQMITVTNGMHLSTVPAGDASHVVQLASAAPAIPDVVVIYQ